MDSDVKVNMENTIKNAERFFMKRHGHDDVAEMLPPNKGVIATKEISRKYFICVRLCVDIEIMRMEVYPGLYVRDPYYEMTLDYLSKVNNHIRIGCMYIERGGQICASIQTSYKNHAISEQTFYELETRLISYIESEFENLERVSAGKLPLEKQDDLIFKNLLHGFDQLMKNKNKENVSDENEDIGFVEEDQGNLEPSLESDVLESGVLSMDDFMKKLVENLDKNEPELVDE